MVPADSRRVPRAPRYSGTTRKQKCIFMYGAVTLCGRPFQSRSINALLIPLYLSRTHRLLHRRALLMFVVLRPRTLLLGWSGLGSSAFARHYWRNHLLVFFSSGY